MMRSHTLPSRLARTGCSVLALATVLVIGASPAAAQFVGTIDTSTGIDTVNSTNSNLIITGNQAVINWTATNAPAAGQIVFLPDANSATFTGANNFAVLNRVAPGTAGNAVYLGGIISSLVGQNVGGTVYFYSPDGIVLGQNASINVGSLGLTTLPITSDGGGNWITGFGTANAQVTFGQAANPNSYVRTNAVIDGGINALNPGSYVAMVAPRVIHNGSINVAGSAALVASEAATITFSPTGLFDITVNSGTADANGVIIGGTITGPQAGVSETQRIYAVAVPKNQALTMAITAGANLGFDVAGAANVVGNAIVLSAGHNIVGGEAATVLAPAGGTGNASITAQNFTATSALTAVAKTDAEIIATTARTLHSDVTLSATREARIVSSTAAGNLIIKGDVEIHADRQVAAGTSGTAGAAALYADSGATLTAEQDVTLTADALGENSNVAGISGGNATGGIVSLLGQFGGQIFVGSNVSFSAEGFGGDAITAGVNAGTGRGGTIQAQTFGIGSLLDVGGNVSATADGWGGFANCASCTGLAGAGDGGFIYIGAANDSTNSTATFGNFESFTSLAAQGFGGGARSGTASATGTGGTIDVGSRGDGSDVTLQGDLYAFADGFGGEAGGAGVNGGLGDGGNVFLLARLPDAILTVTGQSTLTADGYGGNSGGEGCITCNASGGTGIGGEVQLTTSSVGPGTSLILGGLVAASADAYGGFGIAGGGNAIGGGATGSGSAGVAATFAADTSITFNNGFNFSATAEGGDGTDGNGGNATGGRVRSGSQTGATGGSLTVIGTATMDVRGLGGNAAASGTGGTGRGGQSDNGGAAGTLAYQIVDILTQGTGGNSALGVGGAGFGGRGWLEAFGAAITATTVGVNSSAQGGNGATGGGAGTGGYALVGTNTGSLAIGGNASVIARGTGGSGGTGTGGFGGGGDAIIRAIGGNLAITGSVLADTDGTGGDGTIGGVGDGDADPINGVGGARLRAANDSQLTIGGTATLLSRGFGGTGTSFGGAAFGGLSQILAFAGGDVVVGGLTRVDTDAFARGGADGRGGYSQVFAGSGGTIGLNRLNLRADGYGGDDAGQEAGDGYGGTAEFTATDAGSSVTVTNNITTGGLQDREMLSADGFGGITFGNVTPEGGDGTGGTVNLSAAAGGSVSLATTATGANNILIRARGYGGNASANNTIAGEAFGGTLNLVVDGGTMTTGFLQYSTIGQGGTATNNTLNVTGGEGFGGQRHISVLNGGTLTTAVVGGVAGGVGGAGSGTGNGGNGSGGVASLTVNNSVLNLIGNVLITSQVAAGEALGSGNGGNALGGQTTNVNISNGAVINIAAGTVLSFDANGFGGNSPTANGGSATGGTTNASISGSTVTGGGSLAVNAIGQGAAGLTGSGNATGGTATLNLTGSTLNLAGLRIVASGGANDSASGIAGNGAGGTATLNNAGGASIITLSAAPLEIFADGFGGSITGSGGTAGNGTGGLARILAQTGTTLTVNGATSIDARGLAGNSAGSGSGGVGDGGTAAVYTNGGTINLTGNATLRASATGGNATAGAGGNGLGGTARVGTDAGLVSIGGALSLDGSATGGNGLSGGNAVALVSTTDETTPVAAAIYAGNNGAITVGGATSINASATGGSGSNGNGGNAAAGETDIVAYVGDITLAALTLNANGSGGAGGIGGNGGSGAGGVADVAFGLANAAVDGTILMTTATITANGTGGAGGAGINNNTGGNGGAGGAGAGGGIFFIGSAAGGSLQSGNATLSALGIGGGGGAGGNGDSGPGGDGGAGGSATGGFVLAGTLSASNAPGSGGDFDVGNISLNSSATGGIGGNGGNGGGGNGVGGNGGDAVAGDSSFLIRGVAATADAVTLFASATGGNGGTGSTTGNGGNAKTGRVSAEAKDRFGVPAQRGSLAADSINATAIATGGSGGVTGTETVMGGSFFRVLNGDATIGSVNFTIDGNLYDDSIYSDYVSVRDGNAAIGSFSYSTTGALALDASNGSMTASSISLNAANFRPNRADVPAPTVVGSYSAASFAITTGGDFITNANLVSQNALSIVAPGQIAMAGITGQSSVTLDANGGSLTTGNITAAGIVDLDAFGGISLNNVQADFFHANAGTFFSSGDITSDSNIQINSGDDVVLGNLIAGLPAGDSNKAIRIISGGSVLVENINAIGGIDITAAEFVDGGNVTTGDGLFTDALGAIRYGNVSAGLVNPQVPTEPFSVGLVSGASIIVGNVNAAISIGLGATGTLTSGNLTTTADVLGLADGNMSFGAINAGGRVLLADYSMYTNAGGTIPSSDGFDPELVFGAAPVASSGSIIINGPLSAGSLSAAAGTSFSSGNIVANGLIAITAGTAIGTGSILNTADTFLTAGTSITVGAIDSGPGSVMLLSDTSFISGDTIDAGSIYVTSGGSILLGDLSTPDQVEMIAATDIAIGTVTAGQTIDINAGGDIDGGNIIAGDSIYVDAGGSIALLNVSAGIINQSTGLDTDFDIGIIAGTTLGTGNIEAFDSIGLGAQGNISTGNIDAGNIFMVLGGGNMSFGAINAGGPTYLAHSSMIPLGGPTADEFDPTPILAAAPVASGGSILINGPVTTGSFTAAAGTTLTGTTIDSGSSIYMVSGGNMTLTDLDAATTIFQRSGGVITENDLGAGGFIDIRSTGGMALGDLVAGDYIDLRSNGAIGLGNARSGETIGFLTTGTVAGGAMTAGNSVLVEANGAIQLGAVTAGITDPSTSPTAQYAARFSSAGAITTGNVNAIGRIGFGTPTNLITGNLTSGDGLMALVGGSMTSGAINADYVYLANHSMSPLGGTFPTFDRAPILALAPVATGGSINIGAVNTGRFEAAAGTTLTGTTINSAGLLYATSGGNMSLGALDAGNDVLLTSGGNMATGSIDSGDDVALIAAGSISTLNIFADDDVLADAGTTLTTDNITGNSIDLFADGNIATDNLLTQDPFGGQAQLFPGASITVVSGGNVVTGTIESIDGVYVSADGNIATGTINADTFVNVLSAGNMATGNIVAGTDLFAEAGGTMSLGTLAAADIELDSTGNMSFISANSATEFDFSSDASVNGGNVTAGSQISGDAVGSVTLANLLVTGPPEIDEFSSVGIAAIGSISVGNVSGFAAVGFATQSDLTAGNVVAGGLFMTLVGGNTTTGAITTTGQSNGQVYMADDSMFITGGGVIDGEGNGEFDPSIVLALDPVPTGGSITINGPVNTGQFQAAAGDNLVTGAITAASINASAGGTAAINGLWSSPSVFLASRDINITANGRIDAGSAGEVTLNAVNDGGGAVIGDGVTGPGYALSNAEFSRISGGDITIIVGGNGGDADTLIGDLTITGPLAGSNIESNDGGVHFITLQEDGAAFDGTLRVAGDIVATGFGPDNYLAFYTQNFELDAATGLISITGNGAALAGTLEIYASRIHVAEGSLLDQLADNPQFAGYRQALNRQATVQRPGGVIRAANFDIEFGGSDISGPYTLFVQNMGTTTVPAGFLLNAANIADDGEGSLAPGSIDMAINGQINTESGTLTGIAARDLLVSEFGTEPFADGSTINGCQLTGSCSATPIRVNTPNGTDVQLSVSSGLGDVLFGNEGDIDDGQIGGDGQTGDESQSGDEGDRSSPISAPAPLFDTRPLSASEDVDDPVSGAGNPSLYGASDDEDQEDEEKKKAKLKKGDGK